MKPRDRGHGNVTVITDIRDGSKDYQLDAVKARELYEAGDLTMVHCYNDRWSYYDHNAHQRIRMGIAHP